MSVLLIILLALPVAGSRLPVSDPILDGLVRDAVANNFDLRAAAARVREARALRGITAARGKPQVAGDASAIKVERSIAVPGFGDRRLDVFDVVSTRAGSSTSSAEFDTIEKPLSRKSRQPTKSAAISRSH